MSKRTAPSEGGPSAKKQCLDRSGPATLYSTWSVDNVVDFLENNDDFKEVAGKFEGTKFGSLRTIMYPRHTLLYA